jgi:molecular chaperone IbpA
MNMTGWNFNHSFKDFDRFFVGFDPIMKKIADAAEQTVKLAQNYPPYNIKKIDDNKYVIEMAVAGFGKQDIEMELDGDKLVIKGNVKSGEPAEQDSNGEWTWPQVLYNGLAMRPFTRQFNLADNVEIRNAQLLNGILRIGLEAIVPESKKVKIEIEDVEEEK